jgi:hypothetical protein
MLGSAGSRQHFHKNKKSNQIKSFSFEELQMFSLRRLPVSYQMFLFSKNIIFVGEIAPVCSSRLAEKSTGKCCHYNAKLFSKLAP